MFLWRHCIDSQCPVLLQRSDAVARISANDSWKLRSHWLKFLQLVLQGPAWFQKVYLWYETCTRQIYWVNKSYGHAISCVPEPERSLLDEHCQHRADSGEVLTHYVIFIGRSGYLEGICWTLRYIVLCYFNNWYHTNFPWKAPFSEHNGTS